MLFRSGIKTSCKLPLNLGILSCRLRQVTLGARDFSCAVSGFGHVLKSDPREKFFLGASPLVSLAEGRRRVGLRPTKPLVTREKKISGTQGNARFHSTMKLTNTMLLLLF